MTWRSTRYDLHPRFLDEQKDQTPVLPCDESLCVRKPHYNSAFSCYAGNVTEFDDDGSEYTISNDVMCANGYIPQKIDEEPFYFTCCPPISSSYKCEDKKRHCSNVITLSENKEGDTNNTAMCVNASQPYLRPMKNMTYLSQEFFICCDSEITSFRRVYISAGCVYLLSIIVFCTDYFGYSRALVEANSRGDFTKGNNLYVAFLLFTILVSYIFPISCFFLIWGTIIYRKYTPSITGRLKELVLFFYRIVLVFCSCWLPAMGLIYFGSAAPTQIGLLFLSVQPILSTIMAMTKTDVRKYTIELLTLSFIKRKK